jgi:hypothetical protein
MKTELEELDTNYVGWIQQVADSIGTVMKLQFS